MKRRISKTVARKKKNNQKYVGSDDEMDDNLTEISKWTCSLYQCSTYKCKCELRLRCMLVLEVEVYTANDFV